MKRSTSKKELSRVELTAFGTTKNAENGRDLQAGTLSPQFDKRQHREKECNKELRLDSTNNERPPRKKCCVSYLASNTFRYIRYILTVIKLKALQKLETTKIMQHLQRTLKCSTCNIHIWLWTLFFCFCYAGVLIPFNWSQGNNSEHHAQVLRSILTHGLAIPDPQTLKAQTRTKLRKQNLGVKVKNGLCQQQQQQNSDPAKELNRQQASQGEVCVSVCALSSLWAIH